MAKEPDLELDHFRVRCMVEHEIDEDDRVVVLRPRYMSGPFAWWLQPRLKRPNFRVRLDAVGSFVWLQCDGVLTITQIVEAMEAQFGEEVTPALPRLRMFLGEMERGKMIQLIPPEEI